MEYKDLKVRTKNFAHQSVKFALSLEKDNLSSHVSKQLIRSSTSVAANYRAACVAQSKKQFIAKLSIVIEEADESSFWLEFLKDETCSNQEIINTLLNEANELTSIFIRSRKTAQSNLIHEGEAEYFRMSNDE